MGILLAEPITEALKDALMASAALSEVRRVLEIIVPLAYRPPIKVCINRQDNHVSLLSTCCKWSTCCIYHLKCQHMVTLSLSLCARDCDDDTKILTVLLLSLACLSQKSILSAQLHLLHK